MEKRLALLCFLGLSWGLSTAQRNDNTWIMGYTGFGPLVGLSKLTFYEGCLHLDTVKNIGFEYWHNNSALSTDKGDFIASFTGVHVMNTGYGLMENGYKLDKEIIEHNYYLSDWAIPQGSVMLPWPSHPDSILLLYSSLAQFTTPSGGADVTSYGVNMAIINTKSNNGLGKVVSRDRVLIKDTTQYGRLTPVRHANGRDWWLLVGERDTPRFYTILIDPQGPRIMGQQTVDYPLGDGLGQSTFSPDGSTYALHNGVAFGPDGTEFAVFDFDRCSGLLSNHRQYLVTGNFGGVAISPNGRFVYENVRDTAWQYDLQAPDLWASRRVVAVYDGFKAPFSTSLYQMQLAPDGKIYSCATNGVDYLHVIHRPNEPGEACQYQQHGIKLPKYNGFSVPNFPNFRLGPLDGSPCDTLGLNNVPVAWYRYEQDTLDPLAVAFTDLSYYEPAEWYWDFGDGSLLSRDTSPIHVFPNKGQYKVCLTVRNQYGTHTHCKTLYLGVSAQDNPVLQAQIQVSPNPFSERLAVALSAPELRGAAFRLFDATGRLVREMGLEYGINEVETGDLAKGLYFWAVEKKGERVKSGRVIKM